MASDEPPGGDDLLLFPPTIMGYNLQEKAWGTLFVDHIVDEVVWNTKAFGDLVVEHDAKELVKAVVMKQIDSKKSTDFVTRKGNGLIMLLHGAPGTGNRRNCKKPLLRVTCGDIGTFAEVVDQRLRATFKLGKMWDCVVLLDKADMFLEDRDTKDLNRNALVSVFLRALEYYDSILILTSDRVGNFDGAFKSRIHLALHYENLGELERKKIWRDFLARLESIEDKTAADVEDIRDHIGELSKKVMSGREIRDALTIARQLALYKGDCLRYSHLKHAVDVAGKFGTYLEDLHEKMADDMIKKAEGVRYTYKGIPAGLEWQIGC
ncbi:P-loop containing nucleoside triphosphate hydrolase protein [Phaeosphaeriaceae sp. PMI808]|nr:P-loop containing nucleoside triphosphate hydrolase protein [Phaeosphaeriaceae sp. PMI808]